MITFAAGCAIGLYLAVGLRLAEWLIDHRGYRWPEATAAAFCWPVLLALGWFDPPAD